MSTVPSKPAADGVANPARADKPLEFLSFPLGAEEYGIDIQ